MTSFTRLSVLVAGAVFTTAAPAQSLVYTLDPSHSNATFEVQHFGTSTTRGRFNQLSGQVVLDRAAKKGEVSLRINTASVDTGLAVFNARLRQDDLLATGLHPEAFFVATQFRFEGDRVAEVRGEFTLRGTSQPLSLRALRFNCYVPPAGLNEDGALEVCGGDFEAELKRSDFGATFGLPLIGDRIRLLVQVEARRR
jgi:polyisoprenoid-binding protein YceI